MSKRRILTGYFQGEQIEYSGVITDDGFREFVYLTGPKKGQDGLQLTPAERANAQASERNAHQRQQAAFRRLARMR